MADSDARTGFGALLQRQIAAGDPPDFLTILGIKSISGPSITRDTHDTTVMTSPGGWREFIGGLKDGGEVSFTANWLPRDESQGQGDDGLMAEFDKDSCESRSNWRIVVPACPGEPEVYLEFAGILSGQNIEIPMDDLMGFEGTIKVSGRPTLVIETLSGSV
nr:phage tail tube protein [Brevundimonas naejangsanensis]